MKKVLYSLPVMLVLILAFSLSVFADTTGLKDLIFIRCNGGIYDATGRFVEKNIGFFDNSANIPNTTLIRILYNDSTKSEIFTGFRLALVSAGFVRVESGHYFQYSLTLDEDITIDPNPDLKAYVLTSDQTVYELNVSYTRDSHTTANTNITISVGGLVGEGEPIRFGTLYLDFKGIGSNASGYGSYTLVCSNSLTVVPTADQVRHEELLQEIQNVTDQITNEDFGYTTPDNIGGANAGIDETSDFLIDLTSELNSLYDRFESVFDNVLVDNTSVFELLWCWFPFLSPVILFILGFALIRNLVR